MSTEAEKTELLKGIKDHINEWESLDKEWWLLELLKEHFDVDQLLKMMLDQDMLLPDWAWIHINKNPDIKG